MTTINWSIFNTYIICLLIGSPILVSIAWLIDNKKNE